MSNKKKRIKKKIKKRIAKGEDEQTKEKVNPLEKLLYTPESYEGALTGRSLIQTVVGSPIRDKTKKVKSIEELSEIVWGIREDVDYLVRSVTMSACKMTTDVRLREQRIEYLMNKVDPNKVEIRLGGKKLGVRIGIIITILLTLGKLYAPLMISVLELIFELW